MTTTQGRATKKGNIEPVVSDNETSCEDTSIPVFILIFNVCSGCEFPWRRACLKLAPANGTS